MNLLDIDYESYSACDIKKWGAFRYAEDPSTEIVLCGVSLNNGPVLMWDRFQQDDESREAHALLKIAEDPDTLVYAHNSQFELAISNALWKKTFGFSPPKVEQWRCTAAMARRAAIPHSLEECGEFLRVENKKLDIGKKLIQTFSVPQNNETGRNLPTEDRSITFLGKKVPLAELWQQFREYCRGDVVTQQQIREKLKAFELRGEVLESYHMDNRMNLFGVPVNTRALKKARKIVEEYSEIEVQRFAEVTGLSKPSQTGALLKWLKERGYPGEDLREQTMDGVITNPPAEMDHYALEALQIRARTSFAAVAKIPSMIGVACKDGRVRGTLLWSGAIRTHRWAGRLVQVHNFKRPTIKDTEMAYELICAGVDWQGIEMLHGNPMEATASCIRHFIQEPAHQLLDADYSNIEARITPWLSGQTDLLDAFREGRDAYRELAAEIFEKDIKDVTPDERFVGKQGVLSCGYGTGAEKFALMCQTFGKTLPLEVCEETIRVYREKNDKIVSMWKALNTAAVSAIENPGKREVVRGKLTFFVSHKTPFPALIMELPSGHRLVYPYPQLRVIWIFQKKKYATESAAQAAYRLAKKEETLEENDRVWDTKEITFMGQVMPSKKFGRVATWGAKFLENATQSVAGDFLVHGCLAAEKKGYKIIMVVHDQTLARFEPDLGQSTDEFSFLLCTLPAWGADFPLAAECKLAPFYLK